MSALPYIDFEDVYDDEYIPDAGDKKWRCRLTFTDAAVDVMFRVSTAIREGVHTQECFPAECLQWEAGLEHLPHRLGMMALEGGSGAACYVAIGAVADAQHYFDIKRLNFGVLLTDDRLYPIAETVFGSAARRRIITEDYAESIIGTALQLRVPALAKILMAQGGYRMPRAWLATDTGRRFAATYEALLREVELEADAPDVTSKAIRNRL